MSPARRARERERERRRSGPAAATPKPASGGQAARQSPPIPLWRWRTLPVFFAFALGGFIGLQLGLISGAAGNATLWLISTTVFGVMLGLATSRMVTRLLATRGVIKPRPQRRVR